MVNEMVWQYVCFEGINDDNDDDDDDDDDDDGDDGDDGNLPPTMRKKEYGKVAQKEYMMIEDLWC